MGKKPKKQLTDLPEEVFQAGKKAGEKAGKVVGEFKEFISRGNVTDMALGVVVGTAFTAIVNSLVKDVITPLMGLVIGGIDFSSLSVTINSFIFPDFSVTINYGNFLQSVISFFVISICVFFMIKTLNAFRRKKEEDPPPPPPDEHILLLTEIRDLLQAKSSVAADSNPDSSPSRSTPPD